MGKKRVSRKKVLAIILRGRPKSEILEEAKKLHFNGATTVSASALEDWVNKIKTLSL